ncbi:hypothetical protein N7540_009505 [Penicillium herquei]|nr:hypothetical protein N7540_009505 [Penicillium herquei]
MTLDLSQEKVLTIPPLSCDIIGDKGLPVLRREMASTGTWWVRRKSPVPIRGTAPVGHRGTAI